MPCEKGRRWERRKKGTEFRGEEGREREKILCGKGFPLRLGWLVEVWRRKLPFSAPPFAIESAKASQASLILRIT